MNYKDAVIRLGKSAMRIPHKSEVSHDKLKTKS